MLRVRQPRWASNCKASSSSIKADPLRHLDFCQAGIGHTARLQIVQGIHHLLGGSCGNAGEGRSLGLSTATAISSPAATVALRLFLYSGMLTAVSVSARCAISRSGQDTGPPWLPSGLMRASCDPASDGATCIQKPPDLGTMCLPVLPGARFR